MRFFSHIRIFKPLPYFLLGVTILISCDIFSARTPEEPQSGENTWLQPDTPERVIENLSNAIRELNSQNYFRSLSEDFSFQSTSTAESREPLLWSSWAGADELSYFQRLAGAASLFSGHDLELIEGTPTVVSTDVYLYESRYLLTINHSRTDENIPTVVQGRLSWRIEQLQSGLWVLVEWIDVELGNEPSWSDLKAAFST